MKTQVFLIGLLMMMLITAAILTVAGNEDLEDKAFLGKATTTQEVQNVPQIHEDRVLPYGEVGVHVGERVNFGTLSMQVLSVLGDSRCPQDVQCIQAGTVRVILETSLGVEVSTTTIALGQTITAHTDSITFTDAFPYPVSQTSIPLHEYLFTFEVAAHTPSEVVVDEARDLPSVMGACYVGGCSSELCTDTPDMASTCEYHEAYACYKNAVCERQLNGQCGWVPTTELQACLAKAESI